MQKTFLILVFAICSISANVYDSHHKKSAEQALLYTKTGQSLVRYLMDRDIPNFISQYVQGKKALDYGSGTGISAEYLLNEKFDVVGVDINREMVNLAISIYPHIEFLAAQNGSIPFEAETFSLVFSSMVLLELGTETEMVNYLREGKRVLKEDGIFIAVTASQDAYNKDWLGLQTDYPENKNLKSGDLAKAYLCDVQIEFTDYYWTEADYRHFFELAGLDLVEVHYPLAKIDEPYPWKDEKTSSPFVVLVARKMQTHYIAI